MQLKSTVCHDRALCIHTACDSFSLLYFLYLAATVVLGSTHTWSSCMMTHDERGASHGASRHNTTYLCRNLFVWENHCLRVNTMGNNTDNR